MPEERIWELIAKKLAGEATLSEIRELEDRLRKEPDMHYPLQTILDLWHLKAKDEDDAFEAFDRHAERMNSLGIDFETPSGYLPAINQDGPADKPAGGTRVKNLSVIIAVFSLFLAMAIYFSFRSNREHQTGKAFASGSEVSTRYGSKTKLVLPDGSQVWLNSGSRLTYDKNYGNPLREVALTGEAYFDVVKMPSFPFIIHTSRINIRVLGTAFNVKSYPGEKHTVTSLVRGSVEVTFKDRPNAKIILNPNEKLVTGNDEDIAVPKASQKIREAKIIRQDPLVAISHLTYQPVDSTIIETSWMDGKLIFRSETFEELAVQMERWYGISIRFGEDRLRKKKCTGIFENESIEQALTALQLIVPFKYVINKKDVLITQ